MEWEKTMHAPLHFQLTTVKGPTISIQLSKNPFG